MPTGLAGCLVDLKISCGARKLTQTPPSYQKKKKTSSFLMKNREVRLKKFYLMKNREVM